MTPALFESTMVGILLFSLGSLWIAEGRDSALLEALGSFRIHVRGGSKQVFQSRLLFLIRFGLFFGGGAFEAGEISHSHPVVPISARLAGVFATRWQRLPRSDPRS